MVVESVSKFAVAIAKDFVPGINTLTVMKEILIDNVDDTSKLFKEILVDCNRSFSDLDEREKLEFHKECYLIYQYTIQGKAKHNIKLLIQYLKGQIDNNDLYIDNFYKYMDILANLTIDEVSLISKLKNAEVYKVLEIHGMNRGMYKKTIADDVVMNTSYSLQGKGLVYVHSNQDTVPGAEKAFEFELKYYVAKTKTLSSIFKCLNMNLEEFL